MFETPQIFHDPKNEGHQSEAKFQNDIVRIDDGEKKDGTLPIMDDVFRRRMPNEKEEQGHTNDVLSQTHMLQDFEKVLSKDEMSTLRIKLEQGHTFLSMPPIYTGSIAVSFKRNENWVGLEDGIRWSEKAKPAEYIPMAAFTARNTASPDRTLSAHGGGQNEFIENLPQNLVIEALQRICARLAKGEIKEKPDNWNDGWKRTLQLL